MKLDTRDSDYEPVSYRSLIHESIKAKNLALLEELLKEDNADIDQPDWTGTGNAPVLDAAINGELEMVRYVSATEHAFFGGLRIGFLYF